MRKQSVPVFHVVIYDHCLFLFFCFLFFRFLLFRFLLFCFVFWLFVCLFAVFMCFCFVFVFMLLFVVFVLFLMFYFFYYFFSVFIFCISRVLCFTNRIVKYCIVPCTLCVDLYVIINRTVSYFYIGVKTQIANMNVNIFNKSSVL